MDEFSQMTNEELIAARDKAREAAHNAPKSETGQSEAWARRSREWVKLADECDRRGLPRSTHRSVT